MCYDDNDGEPCELFDERDVCRCCHIIMLDDVPPRAIKMPGARASKQVLRDRLAAALEQIEKLKLLRFDLCEDCTSYTEYSDGAAYCDRHEPEDKDHAQP